MSDELDAGDVMGQAPYVLEVSSPGVGRPLASRDQFRRQVGRLVEVTHQDGAETGRLTAVGSDSLTLDVPATKKTPARQVTLDLDAVQRGIVQVEFKRADTADTAAAGATDATDDTHDDTGHDSDETSALEGNH